MTQFEVATAAAFVAFAAARVEVAVVEAGLGGRLDATNTIPSRVTVLTSIGLDHTEWLGETELEIAAEKLAVLRDHTTLVLGRVSPEVAALAERTAAERGAKLIVAPEDPGEEVELRAAGPLPAPQLRPRLRRRRGLPRRARPGPGRRGGRDADRPRPPRARRRGPADLPRRRPQPRRRRRPRRGPGRSRRRPPGRRLPRRPRRQGRRRRWSAPWRRPWSAPSAPSSTRRRWQPRGPARRSARHSAAQTRLAACEEAGLAAEQEPDFGAAVRRGRELAAELSGRRPPHHRLPLRAGARPGRPAPVRGFGRWTSSTKSAGSELLSMMALVAAVVAAVILVFFGLGYLFGSLFL